MKKMINNQDDIVQEICWMQLKELYSRGSTSIIV